MKFEELLITESRICQNCNLRIENPFLEKCPRCFSHLEKKETGCTACEYKVKCSFFKLIKK